MYDRLLELYCSGRLNDAGLDTAVTKNWITAVQAAQIRAVKAQRDADAVDALLLEQLETA